MTHAASETVGPLNWFAAIGAELGDLKRVRDSRSVDTLATRGFREAWVRIRQGNDISQVAASATADALVATRFGAIDREILVQSGVTDSSAILQRAFDIACVGCAPLQLASLRPFIGMPRSHGAAPPFADALIAQPRAGATCTGKKRVILEPPENHGEHCFIVATLGFLLSPYFSADPATVFCAGLAHHLHNAVLPDSGYAGELLLGETLEPLIRELFERALGSLDLNVANIVRASLATIINADTPEGRAFHTADVFDRVLQMRHYDDVARFTARQALDDLQLVHAGPVQAFHHLVLADAGLA